MSQMWNEIPVLAWTVKNLKTMPACIELNAPFLALYQAIVIVHAGQRVCEEKTQNEGQLEAKVDYFV